MKEFLPERNAKILEVGCGSGELAAELNRAGYKVTAIDKCSESVAKAQENGANAIHADFLEFGSSELFDAVFFAHSLHHLRPLPTVLNKVKTLLGQRGKLMAEEFAMEEADAPTLEWFYELDELLTTVSGGEIPPRIPGESFSDLWKKEHRHEPALHTGKDMLREIEAHFATLDAVKVPYLYRSFGKKPGLPNVESVQAKIFDWETKGISQGTIRPIGLRIVAKKHFSYLR